MTNNLKYLRNFGFSEYYIVSIFLRKDALIEFLAHIVAWKINVEIDWSPSHFSQTYGSGSITSVGEERANLSAVVYL